MADHPFRFGPPLARLLHPEQVDVPVQIGLQVVHAHAGEAPQVALDQRAEAVHHLHALEVLRVAHVGLVRLVGQPRLPDEDAVRLLPVVDHVGPRRDMREHPLLHAPRRRLPVADDDRDRVLVHVDGDGDADLLLGEAALARLAVAVREVGVVDVGLVQPERVPEHDFVLVAVDGCEGAVAPLEGGLVGDAAQLGGGVERHVEPHHVDEAHPGRHVILGMLEDGAGQRVEPAPAGAALEPLQPGVGESVPAGVREPAPGARRVRTVDGGGLGEGAEAVPFPALSLGYGGGEASELAGVERRHEALVGVRAGHGGILSAQMPTRQDVAKQRTRWAPGHVLCWRQHHIKPAGARARCAENSTRLLDC